MMTPAPSKDAGKNPPLSPAAPRTAAVPCAGLSEATDLDSADLTVLQAVMSSDEPMTANRLAKITGLPAGQLCGALDTLCELRLLRRLNTVVASYTGRH